MTKEKKTLLIILDGWGHRDEKEDNAIIQARTPYYDALLKNNPSALLQASESYVGLPQGVMGNSEVGHTNIGCGRKVIQDQVRIYDAINDGSFFSNDALVQSIQKAKTKKSSIHLMGLVSTGNVHSAQEHYIALLQALEKNQFEMSKVFFHAIVDGRDTSPKSAKTFLSTLESTLHKTGGQIATVSGRFYAMDRDKRWERTQKAYEAMVLGKGPSFGSGLSVVDDAYQQDVTDEFILPSVIVDNKKPVGTIGDNDLVICFNFRSDRMRQIVRVMSGLDHHMAIQTNVTPDFLLMTPYNQDFDHDVMFSPPDMSMSLGEYLSQEKKKQFRIAETEKYAHVTFFFNGGREDPFEYEDRLLIPSPKVTTYDLTPAMHSELVTKQLIDKLKSNQHDFLVVNYAQPDMVGHTGNWDAAISAVEATDQCLQQLIETAQDQGYGVLLTADHGNIEMMKDPQTGQPHTSHTTHPVPLIAIGDLFKTYTLQEGGALSNIAPTLLEAMDLTIPSQMTAKSLLKKY